MRLIFNTVLVALISLSCREPKQQNEYILPKDFVGYVLILYHQTDNLSNKIVNGSIRTYTVPKNGIVKLNEGNNEDWEEMPTFYYVSKNTKIPFVLDTKNIPHDQIVACGGSIAKSYNNKNSKEYVEYRVYFIGNNEQITDAYQAVESLSFDSISKL